MSYFDPVTWIASHYHGRATPAGLIGAGEWSRAYAFSLDDREAVIRFGAHRDDFEKDAIMAELATASLPIPEVIELGATPEGSFVVSARVHGLFLDQLGGPAMRAVLPSLFAALDAIRAIDTSASSGYGLWASRSVAPHATWPEALLDIGAGPENPRIAGWRAALESSHTGRQLFDLAYAALAAMVHDMPTARHIIHSDLLNRNVLVDAARITAVLDWGNAMYGDWLYDAAWLLYWWPWFPAWSAIDIRTELEHHWQQHGSLPYDLDARLRCYQLHIGLDAQAYNAFTHRWDELERTARRTRALVQR